MVGPSYKELCETALTLDPEGHQKLKEAAKNFLTEWNKTYPEERNEKQGLYNENSLNRIATTYLEEGWNTATLKIDPGKELWKEPGTTSEKRVKVYSEDRESILEGVQKLFGKIQEDRKRNEKLRAKRKLDADDPGLPDIDDLRKKMTPRSLKQPRRHSGRNKKSKYPTLDCDTNEDFYKSKMHQDPADEESLDRNQGRRSAPRRATGGTELSASEDEELQHGPSRRLIWPRTAPSASPIPIPSPQNAGALDKVSFKGHRGYARLSRPEAEDEVDDETEDEAEDEAEDGTDDEMTSQDAVSPGKTHTTMQFSGPGGYRRSSYQLTSGAGPKDLQLLGRIPRSSTKPKAPHARKSLFKPRAMLNVSARKAALQRSRLMIVDGAASTEQGLTINTTSKNETRSSKKIKYGQSSVPEFGDQRSPTLAPGISSQGLARGLEPLRADSKRSGMRSPFDLGQPSVQGEASQITGGTAMVTGLYEDHHDMFVDRRILGSSQSTKFWILKSSHPRKAWVLWPYAELIKENLPSIFAAIGIYTGKLGCSSLEMMLQTPEQSFTFETSRDDFQHFEDMKQFMGSMIEASSAEMPDKKMLIGIWITPIEPNED